MNGYTLGSPWSAGGGGGLGVYCRRIHFAFPLMKFSKQAERVPVLIQVLSSITSTCCKCGHFRRGFLQNRKAGAARPGLGGSWTAQGCLFGGMALETGLGGSRKGDPVSRVGYSPLCLQALKSPHRGPFRLSSVLHNLPDLSNPYAVTLTMSIKIALYLAHGLY